MASLLFVDVTPSGAMFECSNLPTHLIADALQNLTLKISQTDRQTELRGSLEEGASPIEVRIRSLRDYLDTHQDVTVVFGVHEDPFYPFDRKFHASLRLLETLTHDHVSKVVIQTRSPLILLSMPVLLGLRNRLVVRFALEALDDRTNETYTPALPRPSERLKAVRALARLGMAIDLQLAPLIGTSSKADRADELSAMFGEGNITARVVSLRSLLSSARLGRQVGGLRKDEIYERLDRNASDFMRSVVNRTPTPTAVYDVRTRSMLCGSAAA